MSVMTITVWILITISTLISLLNAITFGKKALGTTIVAAGIAASLGVFYFARGFVTTIALIAGLVLIACMIWLIQRNSVSRQKTVAYISTLAIFTGLCAGGASLYANPQQVETINMVAVREGEQVKKYKITDHAPQKVTASVVEEIKATWSKPEPMVHFANQAEPGTNNFGPRQTFATVRDAQFRFGEKLVKDPTFLAAIEETHLNQRNANRNAIEDRAQTLTNREVQHSAAFAELDKVESFTLADYGDVGYESLGMIPSDDTLPKITAFSTQQKMQLVLAAKYKDGKFLMLRVDCDLQPSFFKEFTEIPRYAHKEKAPTQAPQAYTAPKPIGNGNPQPTPKTSTPPSGGGNPPPTPGTTTPPAPSTPPSSTTPPAKTTPPPAPSTPPSSTTPPAKTTPPTQPPATTTPSNPPSTTETTPPAPSTPSSTPPVGDGKKPDAGPDPAPGHEEPAPAPAPQQAEEVVPPPPAAPIDPVVPPAAPAPGIVAPDAAPPVQNPNPDNGVPALPAPPPPVVEVAPAPSNPGQGFIDPDTAPAPAPAPVEQAPIQQLVPVEPVPVNPGDDISQQQIDIPAQEPVIDFGSNDTQSNVDAPSADTGEASFVDSGDISPVAFTYERNNWLDIVIVICMLAAIGCAVQSLRHRA